MRRGLRGGRREGERGDALLWFGLGESWCVAETVIASGAVLDLWSGSVESLEEVSSNL